MQYVWLIPLVIMASALVEWSARDRPRAAWESATVITALAAALVLSALAAVRMAALPAGARVYDQTLATWMPGLPMQLHDGRYAPFQVDWTVHLDPLAVAFLLAIAGAGLLIQWLPRARTVPHGALMLGCLSLMAMAGGFVLVAAAWMGVGAAFLGSVREQDGRAARSTAMRRAFLLMALGDWLVVLALLLVAWMFGTVELSAVRAAALALPGGSASFNLLVAVCLLLAVSVLAKGVLLPLVAWRESTRESGEPLAVAWPAGAMLAAGAYVVLRNADLFHYVLVHLSLSARWLAFPALALAIATGAVFLAKHDWLIDPAAERRSSAVSLWIAAVMNIATYALVRFALPAFPEAARGFAFYFGAACLVGVIVAAVRTLRAPDSAVALNHVAYGQAALAMLGVAGLNPMALTGSVMLAATNGLSLGALLLVRRIRAPWMPAALVTAALAGLAGTFLILQGLMSADRLLGIGAASTWMMLLAATRRVVARQPAARAQASLAIDARYSWAFAAAPVTVLALLAALAAYPAPVLGWLTAPVQQAVAHVRPEYPASAAECDTTVTPAMKAANPAAQFLEAAPCGPDGEPLPPPASSQP